MKYSIGLTRKTALALALGLVATSAVAVHDTDTFELEGNAVQDASPPDPNPDDWQRLYNGGGSATVFSGIIKDKNGTDDIFTGGGSKTPNLIADWQRKFSPPPPDKNNITNAYAANYVVAGEQVIYFGADLFSDNGDAELAFWFFQDDVAPAGTGFTGEHINGDVYVAVKFSNGGTQANIAVYEWDLSCDKQDVPGGNNPLVAGDCAADNIRVVVPEGPATCNGPHAADQPACAITNTSDETSPWPYEPKSGTSGQFPPTTFFEGGINIFEAFGENKCFSSFMATTGASTSFTATAKDFALGDFNVCSVDVSKTCVNDSEADDTPAAITYNVRGCGYNDGGGAINITSLLNDISGDGMSAATPADLVWFSPGQVTDGALRDFDPVTDCDNPGRLKEAVDNGIMVDPSTTNLAGGAALVYQFSESTNLNGATDTVTLNAQGTDGTAIEAATDTATCPLRTFDASFNVIKQCAADLEVNTAMTNLVVVINVEGQVCNTGEVELTDLMLVDYSTGVSVTLDTEGGVTTLAPKGQTGDCVNYSGYYYPNSLPDEGNKDICPFTDMVDATAIAPINSAIGGETGCEQAGADIVCSASSNPATCNLRDVNGDNDCATGPLSPLP